MIEQVMADMYAALGDRGLTFDEFLHAKRNHPEITARAVIVDARGLHLMAEAATEAIARKLMNHAATYQHHTGNNEVQYMRDTLLTIGIKVKNDWMLFAEDNTLPPGVIAIQDATGDTAYVVLWEEGEGGEQKPQDP